MVKIFGVEREVSEPSHFWCSSCGIDLSYESPMTDQEVIDHIFSHIDNNDPKMIVVKESKNN